MKKFLDKFKPTIALFVKNEFWPGYIKELTKRAIPIISFSTRFYKNHFYSKWYATYFLNQLKKFDHIFVQDNFSKQFLLRLGINNVTLGGDTRMDRVLSVEKNAKCVTKIIQFLGNSKCFLAGSIWPEDVKVILRPLLKLLPQYDYKLILTPHEINKKTIGLIESKLNLPFARWSSFNQQTDENKRVLILDTIGTLAVSYQHANIAYVGGGMKRGGLHNILEPAAFRLPILIGKHFKNFKEARDLIADNGIISIANSTSFKKKLLELMTNRRLRKKMGNTNRCYIEKNSNTVDAITHYVLQKLMS